MITDDRYCIDVLNQIEAIKAALKKVQDEILRDHFETCVEHAITSGDAKDQGVRSPNWSRSLSHISS